MDLGRTLLPAKDDPRVEAVFREMRAIAKSLRDGLLVAGFEVTAERLAPSSSAASLGAGR